MELFQRVFVAPSGERLRSKQHHKQSQRMLARAKPWVSAGWEVGRLSIGFVSAIYLTLNIRLNFPRALLPHPLKQITTEQLSHDGHLQVWIPFGNMSDKREKSGCRWFSLLISLFKPEKLKISPEVFALSQFLRRNSDTGLRVVIGEFPWTGKVTDRSREVIVSVIGGRTSTITEKPEVLYRDSRFFFFFFYFQVVYITITIIWGMGCKIVMPKKIKLWLVSHLFSIPISTSLG